LKLALTQAQIDPSVHVAILRGDQTQLATILGTKTNMVCGILPGKEDDDEGEEAPSKDDDEITAQAG
jgi:hypothetical protein